MKWMCCLYCLLSFSVWCKTEKTYIYFEKIESNRTVKIQLPMTCRMYEKGLLKRTVKVIAVKDSLLVCSYFDYDTVKVNQLLNAKIPRKEKDKKVDSLIDASKVYKAIPFSKIEKIELLSSDANTGRKALMLGGGVLILGSGFGLLASTSSHVGQGFNRLDWIFSAGIASGVVGMTCLMKRTFTAQKWRIRPS